MKHNLNKNKLNFRKVYSDIQYRVNGSRINYHWDTKEYIWIKRKRCHRNRKLACKYNICNPYNIPSSWDDDPCSRNYKSWKDRTKRRHQYKIIKEPNFIDLIYKKKRNEMKNEKDKKLIKKLINDIKNYGLQVIKQRNSNPTEYDKFVESLINFVCNMHINDNINNINNINEIDDITEIDLNNIRV